ncbi:hypothetical protein CFC21_034364 [Triticum aestivum]|uniref:F-box domain-containing protein n=2 Tax=Triticum aestivum TaxID=4565 RepID=A0A3B6EBP9_WHEAT|nr:uncharacterized protein LOC123060388 [Triticum aestivum]KAF7021402.1 hypothetical protein CFC21_034364 [Triticum aestivum]
MLGPPDGSILTEVAMEGEKQPQPAVADSSATVSKVLNDDNLLVEILLRVSFPNTLVRAALVCRRWLCHVSDKAFLGRFRKLHPPRLLGFYIDTGMGPRFTPMLPQPPELAAVIDRACFCPDTWQCTRADVIDCRNGRVLTMLQDGPRFKLGVHTALCTERDMTTFPPLPRYNRPEGRFCIWPCLLSKEQGDDLSYFYVLIESSEETTKVTVRVYMLQHGVWCTHHTLATDQPSLPLWDPKLVLVDSKIYITVAPRNIMVLDLSVSSCSTIFLPRGVEYGDRDAMLSRADDASSVYLIQVKEFQLHIWLHEGNNWLLVHAIFMSEMVADLRMQDYTVEDGHIDVLRILQVGDNAEFVFFQMGRCILYLDIKGKTLRKVYAMKDKDWYSAYYIFPFKMVWPPIFPALKLNLQESPSEEQYHPAQ